MGILTWITYTFMARNRFIQQDFKSCTLCGERFVLLSFHLLACTLTYYVEPDKHVCFLNLFSS